MNSNSEVSHCNMLAYEIAARNLYEPQDAPHPAGIHSGVLNIIRPIATLANNCYVTNRFVA